MKEWFLQKNDSEQKILVILAVFSILLLLYTFFYLPLQKKNSQLKNSINDIETEIATMHSLESQLVHFANHHSVSEVVDDNKMMTLIEETAMQQQITLGDIKTQAKNKIAVSLENVVFNNAIRWLDTLQTQHHVNISQLTVESEKKGLTNITLVISH